VAYEIKSELNELLVQSVRTNSSETTLPTRETHIRPLTKLKEPEQRAEVWQRIVDNANGKAIRENAPNCTWEFYCQDRWEMTPQRAGQLIVAHEMLNELKPLKPLVSNSETTGFSLPSSERQIRPLTKLKEPEQRAEVWQRIVDNANGKAIRENATRFYSWSSMHNPF